MAPRNPDAYCWLCDRRLNENRQGWVYVLVRDADGNEQRVHHRCAPVVEAMNKGEAA